ncbi:RES domain-containing protein [Lentimicrobium sp. S6]|uniref:RES domain-containing protein n=1 Tax=Lentimicrobium sp. S6 TaxID=2735872 RepID=UPI001558294A|nr:RES domain-containing protein [Lentimicrobium sp. S6]NPD47907.1 RES family NAD+ phosphorylase [Lentimicrobium sp. S6]
MELRKYIESSPSKIGNCNYCKSEDIPLLNIDEILDFFIELIYLFEPKEEGEEISKKIQREWDLFNGSGLANLIISDLAKYLNKESLTADAKVVYIPELLQNVGQWKDFKEKIRSKKRFLLDIDKLEELGWDSLFNDVVEYTKDIPLYRSRIHYNESSECIPCEKMGAPPPDKVGNGRANPIGIPYLYLSKDISTTFYETKSLNKDELSVAEFRAIEGETLSLVDFTEVPKIFGAFGSVDLYPYVKKILLKRLISIDLSKPIRRYDSELDYIPTQFICEYIRVVNKADGIIFNSSLHKGGVNVVVFNMDKVECKQVNRYIVEGSELSYRLLKEGIKSCIC